MPRRNIVVPTVCIVVLIAVWGFRLPHSSFQWLDTGGGYASPPSSLGAPMTEDNVDLSDPEAPFIGWPLQRVCEETTYVDGLVFICDNNSGGLGNIRNYIQTCLRYALEAGATGLVVPRIRRRSDTDLANLFTDYKPFSYMFDEQHFKHAFRTYCPKITIYDQLSHIPHATSAPDEEPRIDEIVPKEFGNRAGCDWKDQNRHTDRFGDRFRAWLSDPAHGHPPEKQQPRLIRFKWGVLWDWQIYRDGPEFAATFGSILKFNEELLRLGKTALKNMRSMAQSKSADRGDFLGVHLRTENDAMGFWPTYDVQAGGYLQKAQEKAFPVAYLATGNATEAQKFAGQALEIARMQVVTKAELLTGSDLEALNALTWDQQGLVDFVVLLGSTYFVGTMPSSFSVYTAMKRHLKTGGLYTRPYKTGTVGDGLSYLVGNYNQYWEDWLFMWDGMWP
ncbi:uncharacterized protein BCR38DRAFT_353356 [Pseudomassariella vexata]|uniref:Alternative oxidase n=1 Tax=Pseudomassariella vexata TaxID=1141098 RepID=A0A1Y2DFZ7_9PEZI|nr:uncharacterized protein BCR38DRAFT_353356 [Pseudomassariella vexata]ORY58201.1 hypothetical protein BCR38DRAFT_353356 [Pseudomassariella vexata]